MNGEVSNTFATHTHARAHTLTHIPPNQDHLVASPKANDTLFPR